MKFFAYSAFQNMTIPDISYTFPVVDRVTFHATKCVEKLAEFLHVDNSNFCL